MIKLHSLTVNDFKQLKDLSLRFPEKGSVLIEGRNEAGKSTLFEALFFAFFGRPLLADTKLDDLVGYGCTEAIVDLSLDVSGRRFQIGRTLRRGKPGKTKLKITDPDGTVEELTSPTTVNKRMAQELRLDADAFLNSCFVEQKKLEKLEGMTRTERETSLMRLLNLDQMQSQEAELKVKAEDRRNVERQEQRYKLADIVAQIPSVIKQGREAKRKLDIIDVKDGLNRLERYRAGVLEAETRLTALEAPIREHEERLARIESLRAAVRELEIAGVRLQKAEEHEHAIAGIETDIAERDRFEREDLPTVDVQRRKLAVLRSWWSRLKMLTDEADELAVEAARHRAQLQGLDQTRTEATALERRLLEEDARLNTIAIDEAATAQEAKAAELRMALEDWQAATHAKGSLSEIDRQMKKAEWQATEDKRGLSDAAAQVNEAEARLRKVTATAIAGCLLAVPTLALAVVWRMTFLHYPLRILTTVFLATGFIAFLRRGAFSQRLRSAREAHRSFDRAAKEAENALVRLQGQRENAAASQGAAAGRLETAVLKFEALDEPAPTSADDAARRLAALPEGGESPDALRARLTVLREQLATARGAMEEQRKALAVRKAEIAGVKEAALKTAADRAEARAARITDILIDRWETAARERAATLGVPAGDDLDESRNATIRAEAALEAQTRVNLARLSERTALREQIEKLGAAVAAERQQVASSWRAVISIRPDAEPPADREAARSARTEIETEIQSLDEPGTRSELTNLKREEADANEVRFCANRDAAATEKDLRERLTAMKLPADTALDEAVLAEALPSWGEADAAKREAIVAEFEELRGRNGYLTKTRDDLASTLNVNLADDVLDLEKELAAYNEMKRDLDVRERAVSILALARGRIMNKVMPFTIEHMRRILPTLTMDRYHDAELTEDYKIRVWDERASEWKSKNIFSGGTRDQFSLALRLAFAMATLPRERGSAPSFIFLDEPLSSFDAERSAALMYLLTRGEVAETFDQIFVISHSQTIAADEFNFRLRLEGGRVSEPTSDDLKMTVEPVQQELIAA